jgi:glycosyltransferase involved in cell wall biosynthesis
VLSTLKPLVSVLLPVYNGEAYVREAIESVLAQDYPNFEFVIVDNASNDSTPDIIGEYSSDRRLRVIRNDKTVPRLENFVKVFASAAAESSWLKFIGDDDQLLKGCLTEMVRVAEAGDKVGLVSSHYYDGERLVTGALPVGQELVKGPQFLRRLLLEPNTRETLFSPASLLVAHQAYRALGPFRTDLLHADHELFYRVLNSFNLAFVHQPLTVSGYHSGSGQAGSTAAGYTFVEAYLIRYKSLHKYNNLKLTAMEVERVKSNLVNDSVGFMLARIARGDFKAAFMHLTKIPLAAIYHLPLSFLYFCSLALKKLLRREKIKLLSGVEDSRSANDR